MQRSQQVPIDDSMIKEKALFYVEKFNFRNFQSFWVDRKVEEEVLEYICFSKKFDYE